MKTIYEKKIISGIPVITCRKADDALKPLVIMSHGFTGRKEMFREGRYMEKLAEMGYCAVAIDNRLHGDRPGPNFKSLAIRSFGKVDVQVVRKAIKETADDVKLLIDELSTEKGIDTGRIAVTGISMGGFMTYRAMVIDNRIKVGIPFISSPYWNDIPGDIPAAYDEAAKRELAEYSEEYQPANCPEKFGNRPLLIQIGDIDKHYDTNKVSAFYEKMKIQYADCQERLKLIIYPKTKHEFKKEMWDQAVEWLRMYL
ncbi:MAG TPA: alpha/beta fold hydrolase [Clostridia bacterium]|nr:alpha/beta fold hydrolase [Clostridia bacterium]